MKKPSNARKPGELSSSMCSAGPRPQERPPPRLLVSLGRRAAYSACSRAPSSPECICIPHRRRCRRPRCGSCTCGCSSGPSAQGGKLKAQHGVESSVRVPRPAPHREDPALLTRLLQWTGQQRAPGLRATVLHTDSNPGGDADGHSGHHYDMISFPCCRPGWAEQTSSHVYRVGYLTSLDMPSTVRGPGEMAENKARSKAPSESLYFCRRGRQANQPATQPASHPASQTKT